MSTTELPTDPDSPVETPGPPAEEAVPADNAGGDVPDVPDVAEDVAAGAVADAAVSTPRSRRAPLVFAVVLGVLLLGALAIGGWLYLLLDEAHGQIRNQHEQLDEQDQQLEEQKEIIDQKETFSAAMVRLQDTMQGVDGLPFATLAEDDRFQELATRGWIHRWHVNAVKTDTKAAEEIIAKLDEVVIGCAGRSRNEQHRHRLGSNPRPARSRVRIDGDGSGRDLLRRPGDGLRTFRRPVRRSRRRAQRRRAAELRLDPHRSGLPRVRARAAVHQPHPDRRDPPRVRRRSRRMADCYALTMLDGWTLDHRVWVNAYEYWEVSVGYGYTCNDSERQAIRDWNAQLGPTPTV